MDEKQDLLTYISGLKLENPTMLAAGILGVTAGSLKRVAQAGVGAITTKSIGLKPRRGFNNPTVIQVECGLLNAVGLPNPGINNFIKELENLRNVKIPIVLSIFGFTSSEFQKIATIASEERVDALELNLSCPNVKGTGTEIGNDPILVKKIVSDVKESVDIPVFAKLTPNTSDICKLAEAAISGGADAITAINTVRGMAIDIETSIPILSNKFGGLSGGAIRPIAVKCIYEIYEEFDIPIIGCGGVRTWRDAVELMLAGATAVQIGSGIVYEDLHIFNAVSDGIESYIKEKGFRSIKEIVGLAHKR